MLEMRELKGNDVFKMVAIINAAGVVKSFREIFGGERRKAIVAQFQNEKSESNDEHNESDDFAGIGIEVMAEVTDHILRNLDKAKGPINELLADLTGKKAKDIEDLPLNEYMTLIINFFKKEELKDFFGYIAPLLK